MAEIVDVQRKYTMGKEIRKLHSPLNGKEQTALSVEICFRSTLFSTYYLMCQADDSYGLVA